MMRRWIALLALALTLAGGCNRNVEPFDPEEPVAEPDLSAIFPDGAERAKAETTDRRTPMPMGRLGTAALSAPPLTGEIRLAPELAARVPPGAVLFLMAWGAGSGPPVAVRRISNPEFPLAFELGPEDRMGHEASFEGPLRLTARIDGDGDAATHRPGDLQGAAEGTYAPGATGVTILIDEAL